MAGINVLDDDGDSQFFADATTWHIDDRGQLHLKKEVQPVASFAKDRWQAVGFADEVAGGDTPPLSETWRINKRDLVAVLEEAVERGTRRGSRDGVR